MNERLEKENKELREALQNIKSLGLDYALYSQEQLPLVEGMYRYAEEALEGVSK